MKRLAVLSILVLGLGFSQLAEGITPANWQRGIAIDATGHIIPAATYDEGLTTISTNAVSVLATSTQILTANANREYVAIINDGSTVLYLAFGNDAVSEQGIRLNASGGSYEMSGKTLFLGAINGISSATLNATWAEGI